MKKFISLFLTAFLIVFLNASYSQLQVTGEIRPRTEYRHGYKTLIDTGQTGALFTEQRARLNFNYVAENYKISMSIQDIRTWGSQPQLNKTDGLTSFHTAWAEYHFTSTFSAQLGRQELNYNDERILGAGNWTQQGRSHDLVLLKYSDSTFTIHGGLAYNQNADIAVGTPYTVTNNYKELQFLWLNKKIREFDISILILNNGLQSPTSINGTRFSQTIGPYIEFKKNQWKTNFRAYYQEGTDGGSNKNIKAYLCGTDVFYSLPFNLKLGIGAELLSGQSQTDTTITYQDKNHSFNPLYGTVHKFNGYMDYFYLGSNHINSVGLIDIYSKALYKQREWWIGLDVHKFMAAADVVNPKVLSQQGKYVAMNSSLGTELDLTFVFNLTKGVSMQAGYSHMFDTETLRVLRVVSKAETNNWGYFMLTFKPQLIPN